MYTKEQIELVDEELDMLTVEIIAAACHQQNKTYCILHDDDSQVRWSEAPEWQKTSAVNGVKSALVNPDPAASHEGWLQEKVAAGWVYGTIKDAEKKEHPCLVDYSELPSEQKGKDDLFIEMVQQLGLAADLIRVVL